MQPIVYLFFRGTCAEALSFYAAAFGSEEPELLTVASMPPEVRSQMPPMADETVMHGAVKVGMGWIYASDDMGDNVPAMAGASISVALPTVEETHRVFAVLAEGGEVRMPLEATFFAPAFGTLTDRFGTRWMIMADAPEAA
ncbi:VOC family protein [Pseudooceanicola sp. LIPI14-2-Ac024]|uniref:VOC family protein n=1 Tax=Pseudooceanicola sp. LIPI14-2-Ac024 TaxID=3344875 RepID=UPI0035CECC81